MPSEAQVRVLRSGLQESVHLVDVAVVDVVGALVASAGDADRVAFARSSMKPLQATVSMSRAPFPFTDDEVAVMCASHNAEPVHRAAVRGILARAERRRVGAALPERPAVGRGVGARRRPSRAPINSDCSGKHAGMLAACTAQGWPLETYRDPGHPLQGVILEGVLAATGRSEVQVGVDGCGVPVHGMPLRSMAAVFASLARPDRLGPLSAARRPGGRGDDRQARTWWPAGIASTPP